MKVIVFDLGGTLMQYVGMPYSWVEFYRQGLEAIINKYDCEVSQEDIEISLQKLKEFNPRVSEREVEYSAEFIFGEALSHWHVDMPIRSCVETFWGGLELRAKLYPDTIEVLQELRKRGYVIAALTDLPSAMPDDIFRRDIEELSGFFDYYVSSYVAGYRKPCCKGMQMISKKFSTPMEELVFVGDEEKDKKTAENANCKFILAKQRAKRTCSHVHLATAAGYLTWIQRGEHKDESICDLYKLLEILG